MFPLTQPPQKDAAQLDEIREFDHASLKQVAVQTDPPPEEHAEVQSQIPDTQDTAKQMQSQTLSGWANLKGPGLGVVATLAVYGAYQLYENYGGAGLVTAAAVTGAGCHFLRKHYNQATQYNQARTDSARPENAAETPCALRGKY